MKYFTQYDKDYGTCHNTYCEIVINTASDNPDVITKLIGIKPTNTCSPTNENRTYINGWIYSTADLIDSKDARDHIDLFLDLFYPHRETFKRLYDEKGYRTYMKCVWFSEVGHGGPALWPKQMKQISDMDIELNFAFLPLTQ